MTADAVGGVWTYSLTLARAMRERRVQYEIATMGPRPSEAQRADETGIPGLNLHESTFKLEWMDHPWRDVDRAGAWLIELARRLEPDLIHLNGYAHAALDFGAPKIVVAHSCVCSWWRAVHQTPAPAEWNEYRRRVRDGLDAADLVIAPSHTMLGDLEREYGALNCPAFVVPNAAALAPCSVRNQPDSNFILAAGRFSDESKNLALLTRIAPRLAWPVYAAGEAALGSNLRTLGRLDHAALLSWMSRASILCHPALYEPFGLAPLEAALAGCALALADIPSLRETWSGAALFFDPRNDASAISALETLISDAALRRKLTAAARLRGAELTPQLQASRYFDLYLSALASSGRETALPAAWLT